MNFFICSAQTFSLQELETYAKYDFEKFTSQVLGKGYEFYTIKDENVWFQYTATSVKHIYGLVFNSDFISYTTTYKTNYTSLDNSLKSSGYKYTHSDNSSDRVCYLYEKPGYTIRKCLSTLDDKTPVYVFRIIPQNNTK